MPAITAPAVAVAAATTGTTTSAVAANTATDAPVADAFASLLSAMTGTAVDTPTTPVLKDAVAAVDAAPVTDTEPAVDLAAMTAAALAGATVAPVLMPDTVPTVPTVPTNTTTPTVEKSDAHPETSAQALAPGRLKEDGTSAKGVAPGQVKGAHESAKAVAPGQRAHVADAPPAPPQTPPTETVTPAPPVDAAVTATAPAPAATAVTTVTPVTPPAATEPTHTVRPAIAAAAKRLTHQGDRTSLVVRLDPPELGAVLVRMTVREGQVEVTLRAPDLAAQGGLLAQAPEIQQVLREAGLDLTSFDVSYGELTQGQPQERRGTPDRGTPQQRGGADGTVHVTDDVTDPQPAGTWL